MLLMLIGVVTGTVGTFTAEVRPHARSVTVNTLLLQGRAGALRVEGEEFHLYKK